METSSAVTRARKHTMRSLGQPYAMTLQVEQAGIEKTSTKLETASGTCTLQADWWPRRHQRRDAVCGILEVCESVRDHKGERELGAGGIKRRAEMEQCHSGPSQPEVRVRSGERGPSGG